jgi:plastocyanin
MPKPCARCALIVLLIAFPAAAEYREIPITNGATITGQVRVAGEVPKLPPQPVFKQTETCGTEMPDERLIVGAGGALQNAIVYLTDIKAGKAPRLEQSVRLDNRKCAFVPHVLTATVGQTLDIHNSDPFLHDAHALLGSRTLFNVAIIKDRTVHQPLLESGLIHINCNVRHTWMHAYLYVSEHPYHAVTDSEGRFRLEDVPPGVWTLRVWHELLGSLDRQVRLNAGETSTQEITLQAAAESGQ